MGRFLFEHCCLQNILGGFCFFGGKGHGQLLRDFERKVWLVFIGYFPNLLFAFELHMEEQLSGSSVPLTA